MPARPGPKRKLTASDDAQIASLIRAGISDAQIAEQFGVSRATVNRLRHHLRESPPQPRNKVTAMIERNNKRRAILDQIEVEYNANGESGKWAELWELANALVPRSSPDLATAENASALAAR